MEAALQAVLWAPSDRLEGIDVYVERLAGGPASALLGGLPEGEAGDCVSNCVAYKTETVEANNQAIREVIALGALEVGELADMNPSELFLRAYAGAAVGTQEAFNQGVANAGGDGIIADVMSSLGTGETSAYMNPFTLMASAGAGFTSRLADDVRDARTSLASSNARAQNSIDQKLAMAEQMREDGIEIVAGVEGRRYSSPPTNQPLSSGGGPDAPEGRITGGFLVIDPERNVILKQRTEGTMTRDGETQDFFIEVVNTDFRNPPGCGELIVPFRRITRIGGIMTEAERAQMAEAQAQLAEFEQQMASMPPQQRQMMESMMGSQMQAVRSLASGGAMETTQDIEEVYCNPDLAALFGTGMGTGPMEGYDLVLIQEYLLILGYEPGNTEGVLDTLTEIAISTFQAERGMAVTGQPSLALQQALAAEMG